MYISFYPVSKEIFLFRTFVQLRDRFFALIQSERMWIPRLSKKILINMALNIASIVIGPFESSVKCFSCGETKISSQPCNIIPRKLFTSKKSEAIRAIPFHNFFLSPDIKLFVRTKIQLNRFTRILIL